MKKITLLLLLLCAIPVAALREGGHRLSDGKAAHGIALFMSQVDTDFSDLDVRDAQGNAVQNPSAKQALETLFRENLITLTVFEKPHSMRQIYSWLDSFSHLFNKLIFMRVLIAFDALQDILLPAQRRFVHNVHNLCTTFSVGGFAGCLLLFAFTLQRSPRNIHLRC
jgi:hypothetical protein